MLLGLAVRLGERERERGYYIFNYTHPVHRHQQFQQSIPQSGTAPSSPASSLQGSGKADIPILQTGGLGLYLLVFSSYHIIAMKVIGGTNT